MSLPLCITRIIHSNNSSGRSLIVAAFPTRKGGTPTDNTRCRRLLAGGGPTYGRCARNDILIVEFTSSLRCKNCFLCRHIQLHVSTDGVLFIKSGNLASFIRSDSSIIADGSEVRPLKSAKANAPGSIVARFGGKEVRPLKSAL